MVKRAKNTTGWFICAQFGLLIILAGTLLLLSPPAFAQPGASAPDQTKTTPEPTATLIPTAIPTAVVQHQNFLPIIDHDGTLSPPPANPIVKENQQPGTSNWQANHNGQQSTDDSNGQILGYASATSVNKGDAIDFQVSVNPTQNFTITVYRLGWYGGTGGRLMRQIGPLAGIRQPVCPQDVLTGLTECHWSSSYTLTVPLTWTTGIYLVVLDNAQNYQSRFTFAVRDDHRVADFLYQQPVTTYQAYNNYPNNQSNGKSLYDFNSLGMATVAGTARAVKVSFDRPRGDRFEDREIYLVHWLERMGYDVSYTTDLDTQTNPARLLAFKGVLSAPHDEYWTKAMFDAFEQARDHGVDLAFLGANALYWQARVEPSSSGIPNRVLTCYKNAAIDPNPDASLKTIHFRNTGRPEQTLIGVQFTADGDFDVGQPFVVQNSNHWLWNGTGFTNGSTVPGLVGYEIDRRFTEYPGPTNVNYTVLGRSPYQAIESVTGGTSDIAEAVLYQAPSSAWVFASGTMNWSWALDKSGVSDPGIQRATQNLLDRFVGK